MKIERICRICGDIFYGDKRSSLCKNKACRKEVYRTSCTEETKRKISEKRKLYLKNNPDKHPWKRSDKFKSVPCEKLKQILKEKNINFVEEWQPVEDRYFSIDIAFPDIKLGIEINGNQHYNTDGSLKRYYQERHDIITEHGWRLIELHYSTCFDILLLDEILNLKTQPDYTKYFEHKLKTQLKKKNELSNNSRKKLYEQSQLNRIDIIKNTTYIDYSKFGWVKEVSILLNIKHQKVGKWMQRFCPEIYKNSYKRKQPCA